MEWYCRGDQHIAPKNMLCVSGNEWAWHLQYIHTYVARRFQSTVQQSTEYGILEEPAFQIVLYLFGCPSIKHKHILYFLSHLYLYYSTLLYSVASRGSTDATK